MTVCKDDFICFLVNFLDQLLTFALILGIFGFSLIALYKIYVQLRKFKTWGNC